MKTSRIVITILALFLGIGKSYAQLSDIFVMPGSDVDRPGLALRSNLNVGVGYAVKKINNKIVGNELTFAYSYENIGSHGFWNTNQAAHTESFGVMHGIPLVLIGVPIKLGLYTWFQAGITELTNQTDGTEIRLSNQHALGLTYKLSNHNNIWFQEQYNKVETAPWYTTTSLGYDYSF
jgi:hypothetical protein